VKGNLDKARRSDFREELGADQAEAFGNQPDQVIEAAKEHAQHTGRESFRVSTQTAVTFSKKRNLEREAVVEERELLRDALRRSMGEATLSEVRGEFEKRVQAGEFIDLRHEQVHLTRHSQRKKMIDYERDTIQVMQTVQSGDKPSLRRTSHAFPQTTVCEQQHSQIYLL
jgi:hypothetical protein